MNSSKKIFIIPGFLRPISFYEWSEGREIWGADPDVLKRIEAEYVMGYSLGAIGALLNWQENKNTKLILINPLFPRRSVVEWIWRWLKFLAKEGAKPRQLVSVGRFLAGLKLAHSWLKVDAVSLLEQVPREDVFIFRGSNDNFFFDQSAADFIRAKNFRIIEVEGVAHDWDEKIKAEVEKYI